MTKLYHGNTSEPGEAPLLVKPISHNVAMDGTNGKEVGGLLFASGGDVGQKMGMAYAMKSQKAHGNNDDLIDSKNGTMACCGKLGDTVIAVMNDRESFINNPPTGYLYELPDDSFRQVINSKSGAETNEYISEEEVVASNVTVIIGADIPMENGVQVFYLNQMSKADYFDFTKDPPEVENSLSDNKEQDNINRALKNLDDLVSGGKLIYENKERGFDHLDLKTGELISVDGENRKNLPNKIQDIINAKPKGNRTHGELVEEDKSKNDHKER